MRQIFLLILLVTIGQWVIKALRRAQLRSGSQGPGARGGQGAWRTSNGAGGQAGSGGPAGSGGARRTNSAGALPEPMVRCAECGVHAPRSESVSAGSQSFCSHEHARQWSARESARAADQDRAAR